MLNTIIFFAAMLCSAFLLFWIPMCLIYRTHKNYETEKLSEEDLEKVNKNIRNTNIMFFLTCILWTLFYHLTTNS